MLTELVSELLEIIDKDLTDLAPVRLLVPSFLIFNFSVLLLLATVEL